jgi:hypothetical protein
VSGLRRLHLEELCSGAPHVLDLGLPAKQQLTSLHLALHAFLPSHQVQGPGRARPGRAFLPPPPPPPPACQPPPRRPAPPPQKRIHDLSPLSRLSGLQHLTLQGTAMTINPQTLPHLAHLAALRTLHLQCPMEDLEPLHFQGVLSRLEALRDLMLPFFEVEASLWGALAGLPRLQRLACGTVRLAAEDAQQQGGAAAAGGAGGGAGGCGGLRRSASLQQLDMFESRLGGLLRWSALAPALRCLQMRMCYTTSHMQALAGHQALEVGAGAAPPAQGGGPVRRSAVWLGACSACLHGLQARTPPHVPLLSRTSRAWRPPSLPHRPAPQDLCVRQVSESHNDVSPQQLAGLAALGTLRSLRLSQRSLEDEHLQVGGARAWPARQRPGAVRLGGLGWGGRGSMAAAGPLQGAAGRCRALQGCLGSSAPAGADPPCARWGLCRRRWPRPRA